MLSTRKTVGAKPIGISNKDAKILYLSNDFELEKNTVEIPDLTLLPPIDKDEREVIYISAPSGAGKSHLARDYIEKYQTLFPKRDIYIFSTVTDDAAFKKLKKKNVFFIPVDESLVENPINVLEEMKDCLVLLDDCDQHSGAKELDKALDNLIKALLEVGRHVNCTVLITSHLLLGNNKGRTRIILNEASRVVIFPKAIMYKTIAYFLSTYLGITDKNDIKDIASIKSRWVCLSKSFPIYAMWQSGARVL